MASERGRRAGSGTRRTTAFLGRQSIGLASCARRSTGTDRLRTVSVRGRWIDSFWSMESDLRHGEDPLVARDRCVDAYRSLYQEIRAAG
jgi:hypothetical protein